MSTRSLARSAVEGGRSGRWDERTKTRINRRKVKALLKDPEATEAKPVPKRKKSDWGSFRDKLRPLYRFLQKNAGRPWNKVYAELCERFDRRTLKGWHLLSAHVDRYTVIGHGPALSGWASGQPAYGSGPYVDGHGILRYTQRRWRSTPAKKDK